jgi:hypothetical protein
VTRGINDGGGARVVARVWFGAKWMWGDVGEVHPSLYRGVGVSQRLRFKLEIKCEFG